MTDPLPKATLAVTMTAFTGERVASAVSKLVSEFCRCLVDDADVAARFRMAAQELAENLVKYSDGRHVSIEAELTGTGDSAVLRLRAKNRGTPDQLRDVERRLYELTHTDDPVALYDRLILETAPRDDGSGLGLARIRAEGGLDVDYSIDGAELTVSVHASVRPREEA